MADMKQWFEGYWLGLSIEAGSEEELVNFYDTVPRIEVIGGKISLESYVFDNKTGICMGSYRSNSMDLKGNELWMSYEKDYGDATQAMGVSVYRFEQSDIDAGRVNDLSGQFMDNKRKADMNYVAMRISEEEYVLLRGGDTAVVKKLLEEKNRYLIPRIRR